MANPTSKTVLGLLVAILVISIAAVALIVNVLMKRPSRDDLVSACGPVVTTAVNQKLANVQAEACPETVAPTTPTTIAFPAGPHKPGFNYPVGWSAAGGETYDAKGNTVSINLMPGYIFACAECDGPAYTVQITSGPRASFAQGFSSVEAYLQDLHKTDLNIATTSATQGKGKIYTVSGQLFGALGSGLFDAVYYVTEARYVLVQYNNEESGKQDANWKLIKDSLDFSAIE